MKIGDQITIDRGTITVEKRSSDFEAFYTHNRTAWEAGETQEMALGKLCARDEKWQTPSQATCYSGTFQIQRQKDGFEVSLIRDPRFKEFASSEYVALGMLALHLYWDKDNPFSIEDLAQEGEEGLTQFCTGQDYFGTIVLTKEEAEAYFLAYYPDYASLRFHYGDLEHGGKKVSSMIYAQRVLGRAGYKEGYIGGAVFGKKKK